MPDYRGRAVFVGNLPESIRESDLDDLFYKVCVFYFLGALGGGMTYILIAC